MHATTKTSWAASARLTGHGSPSDMLVCTVIEQLRACLLPSLARSGMELSFRFERPRYIIPFAQSVGDILNH